MSGQELGVFFLVLFAGLTCEIMLPGRRALESFAKLLRSYEAKANNTRKIGNMIKYIKLLKGLLSLSILPT